jgi:hypothetical protein
LIERLLEVMRHPCDEQPEHEAMTDPESLYRWRTWQRS